MKNYGKGFSFSSTICNRELLKSWLRLRKKFRLSAVKAENGPGPKLGLAMVSTVVQDLSYARTKGKVNHVMELES